MNLSELAELPQGAKLLDPITGDVWEKGDRIYGLLGAFVAGWETVPPDWARCRLIWSPAWCRQCGGPVPIMPTVDESTNQHAPACSLYHVATVAHYADDPDPEDDLR